MTILAAFKPESMQLAEGAEVRYRCYLCGQESVLPSFVLGHECPNLPAAPTPVIVSFYPAKGAEVIPPPSAEPKAFERRGE